LKRALSLPLLTAYGVGTMVGGGFYALLGRVAGHAGMNAPLAFLIAAGVAFITALSFGELASRLPYSAGESRYVHEAFGVHRLSTLIGWLVIATGVVSAATLARAFVGFLNDLFPIATGLGIVLIVILLTGIALWGIAESVFFATVITVIEVAGLIWVLCANAVNLTEIGTRFREFIPNATADVWSGIFVASFLAFYSFIGFEDMVNEAEEVQDPERNLPRAILIALGLTSVLYLLIVTAAVLVVPPQQLAASHTPLALLVSDESGLARVLIVFISMLAGVNGALVQIVMSSRVAYGMADLGMAPRALGIVHPKLRTPVRATILMGGITLAFALWLPLETLARVTSGIMLFNFAIVNASLVRIKHKAQPRVGPGPNHPTWIPIVGCILCVALLATQIWFVASGR
jgi:APA family basic amino acid/polyamine antiporter